MILSASRATLTTCFCFLVVDESVDSVLGCGWHCVNTLLRRTLNYTAFGLCMFKQIPFVKQYQWFFFLLFLNLTWFLFPRSSIPTSLLISFIVFLTHSTSSWEREREMDLSFSVFFLLFKFFWRIQVTFLFWITCAITWLVLA